MIRLPLAILCGLLLLGCGASGDRALGGKPASLGVLVTLGAQERMVREIGGDRVEVTTLIPPGQSPHQFEPAPSVMRAAARADLYLTVGSGVEFERLHLETIRQQNQAMTVVACAEGIPLRMVEDHDHGEHHGGVDEGTTDPHVWLSPANLVTMADRALAALVAADPGGEADYRLRHAVYVERVGVLDTALREELTPYAGRAFLVYHPSWGYFADAYGLEQIAVEQGGQQPGPAGVAAVITQARERSIHVVFASPQFDTTAAETIAREIDGEVVAADPLGPDVEGTLAALGKALVRAFEVPDAG